MFIPLHDANKLKYIRLQYVTLALIALNVIVFLGVSVAPEGLSTAMAVSFGYIPAVVYGYEDLPAELAFVPEQFSFITYAFLHADFMHLGSNMLFLWVFGDNVEDATGHFRYLVFYLVCAAVAAFAHSLTDLQSVSPLIGASGAVSGIIGAYLILHPKVMVWVLAFGRIPLRLPAFIPLVLWIGLQVVMILLMPEDQVSFAAHAGGVLAGVLLVFLFKRRGVPILDRKIVVPEAVVLESESKVAEESRPTPSMPWGRQ